MDQVVVNAPQGMMHAQVSNPVVVGTRPGISPGVAQALNQIETETLTAAEKQMIEAQTAENLGLPQVGVLPSQVPVMGLSQTNLVRAPLMTTPYGVKLA